jgi:hypothetical protein
LYIDHLSNLIPKYDDRQICNLALVNFKKAITIFKIDLTKSDFSPKQINKLNNFQLFSWRTELKINLLEQTLPIYFSVVLIINISLILLYFVKRNQILMR